MYRNFSQLNYDIAVMCLMRLSNYIDFTKAPCCWMYISSQHAKCIFVFVFAFSQLTFNGEISDLKQILTYCSSGDSQLSFSKIFYQRSSDCTLYYSSQHNINCHKCINLTLRFILPTERNCQSQCTFRLTFDLRCAI